MPTRGLYPFLGRHDDNTPAAIAAGYLYTGFGELVFCVGNPPRPTWQRLRILHRGCPEMKHAPAGYDCPFCRVVRQLAADGVDSGAFVLDGDGVLTLVPLHYWGGAKGNCLIIPKRHFENVFDIDEALGGELLRVTKRLAAAMKEAFHCDGISTRQHNEPAGGQDVWHYHTHVFPRFHGDGLYGSSGMRYADEERLVLAAELRGVLRQNAVRSVVHPEGLEPPTI